MNTKIFCDIADFNQIIKFNKKNIVKGFTTNPSLMRKAGAKNYETYCKKILKICKKKPVSFEVFGDNDKSMIDQGLKISSWSRNVFVKVPIVNSKNKENAIKLIKYLQSDEAQKTYINNTYEYSVNPSISPNNIVKEWGEFKIDDLDLNLLGSKRDEAIRIFDKSGWK